MSEDFTQPPPFPTEPPPPPPDRRMVPIITIQVAILVLINIVAFAVGASSSSQHLVAQVLIAAMGIMLQVIILFFVALFMSLTSTPTAPSWWIALGVVVLLALPTCWAGALLTESG
jgi:uncharacterized protein (DUF697 family)